jgi:hypothetical protein
MSRSESISISVSSAKARERASRQELMKICCKTRHVREEFQRIGTDSIIREWPVRGLVSRRFSVARQSWDEY